MKTQTSTFVPHFLDGAMRTFLSEIARVRGFSEEENQLVTKFLTDEKDGGIRTFFFEDSVVWGVLKHIDFSANVKVFLVYELPPGLDSALVQAHADQLCMYAGGEIILTNSSLAHNASWKFGERPLANAGMWELKRQ